VIKHLTIFVLLLLAIGYYEESGTMLVMIRKDNCLYVKNFNYTAPKIPAPKKTKKRIKVKPQIILFDKFPGNSGQQRGYH